MIRLDETYSEHCRPADEKYPYGAAVDASDANGFDGTPYLARWRNDVIGAMHAVFHYAFRGTPRTLSNKSDNVKRSDFLDALLHIVKREAEDNSFHTLQIQAESSDVVVSWEELEITFDEQKNYLVYAHTDGWYENFLPIGTESLRDGVHLHIRQLLGGAITNVDDIIASIRGNAMIKWGSFNWGEKLWGEEDPGRLEIKGIKINLLVKAFPD